MTVQEAIERIKWRKFTASDMVGMGEDGKAFEDFDVAIEALEKQIVKKCELFYLETDGYRLVFNECTVCGEIKIKHGQKYCHECGQKLDWGE